MWKMRKLTAAVAVGAALAVPVVAATTAVAETADRAGRVSTAAPVPAWWYEGTYQKLALCESAGQDYVNRGIAVVYSCDLNPAGFYDLRLFTN